MPEAVVIVGGVDTPLGRFGAALTSKGLAHLNFPGVPLESVREWAARREPHAIQVEDDNYPVMQSLGSQLTAYFDGTLREFDVRLDLRGTPFQVQVWEALKEVRYGETRTYAQIAACIGRPQAVRAVGAANGANPIPIIVPCHRIIGRDGLLVGYGGGLTLKRQLLELEGVLTSFASLAG